MALNEEQLGDELARLVGQDGFNLASKAFTAAVQVAAWILRQMERGTVWSVKTVTSKTHAKKMYEWSHGVIDEKDWRKVCDYNHWTATPVKGLSQEQFKDLAARASNQHVTYTLMFDNNDTNRIISMEYPSVDANVLTDDITAVTNMSDAEAKQDRETVQTAKLAKTERQAFYTPENLDKAEAANDPTTVNSSLQKQGFTVVYDEDDQKHPLKVTHANGDGEPITQQEQTRIDNTLTGMMQQQQTRGQDTPEQTHTSSVDHKQSANKTDWRTNIAQRAHEKTVKEKPAHTAKTLKTRPQRAA